MLDRRGRRGDRRFLQVGFGVCLVQVVFAVFLGFRGAWCRCGPFHLLLEAGEAHSGSVAVGDFELGGYQVPVNLVQSVYYGLISL